MDLTDKLYHKLVAIAVGMLLLGTVFYHHQEHFTWVDAYYFSVVTLATVGYGDLTPHTDVGKIFTTFYILGGVGIITTFITYTMKRKAYRRQERMSESEDTE